MRNAVGYLTGNHVLNVTFFAFLIAQIMKVVVVLLSKKKLDFRRLVGSGGMPSSHAATVSCLAASVGKNDGTHTILFAAVVVFAVIVMYDASNVRRAAGEQVCSDARQRPLTLILEKRCGAPMRDATRS